MAKYAWVELLSYEKKEIKQQQQQQQHTTKYANCWKEIVVSVNGTRQNHF